MTSKYTPQVAQERTSSNGASSGTQVVMMTQELKASQMYSQGKANYRQQTAKDPYHHLHILNKENKALQNLLSQGIDGMNRTGHIAGASGSVEMNQKS